MGIEGLFTPWDLVTDRVRHAWEGVDTVHLFMALIGDLVALSPGLKASYSGLIDLSEGS